jgi:hypothetical protein
LVWAIATLGQFLLALQSPAPYTLDIQLHKEEQVLAGLGASPSSHQELPGEGNPNPVTD